MIKFNESIRALRQKNGCTQETLAKALGVTAQAVSRWESGGGYPDMELLPQIANYFHVTIDALFGYDNGRAEWLGEICRQADRLIGAGKDMGECISLLRGALAEYPAEPILKVKLAFALTVQGVKSPGLRAGRESSRPYMQFDREYNESNACIREALELYEAVVDADIDAETRSAVVTNMSVLYTAVGQYDKSEALAQKQPPLRNGREYLLAFASEGEMRSRYLAGALLELMKMTREILTIAICFNESTRSAESSLGCVVSATHMLESLFPDGNCCTEHIDLRDLYLFAANLAARSGDTDNAAGYFDAAFAHHKKYEAILKAGWCRYTSPLLTHARTGSGKFIPIPGDYWKTALAQLPDELTSVLRADERFSECFA